LQKRNETISSCKITVEMMANHIPLLLNNVIEKIDRYMERTESALANCAKHSKVKTAVYCVLSSWPFCRAHHWTKIDAHAITIAVNNILVIKPSANKFSPGGLFCAWLPQNIFTKLLL